MYELLWSTVIIWNSNEYLKTTFSRKHYLVFDWLYHYSNLPEVPWKV